MTTYSNPNLSIFKTLISLNSGRGCPEVETNTASKYMSGGELSMLDARVRIYKKRKDMYTKTNTAIAELKSLASMIVDVNAQSTFASSNATSMTDQKKEVEQKVKEFKSEFAANYQTLVDEDQNSKPVGGIGYDLRAKQGMAPAVAGGPFKTSDDELNLAIPQYKLDRGTYAKIEDLVKQIELFDDELSILKRISPTDEETLLTKFNFNPWDTLRANGLPGITAERRAREKSITDYIDAFNAYNPTDAGAKQTKINTYVNPAKLATAAQGSSSQFGIGRSGLDIIHKKSETDLQADTLALEALQTALNAQVGGLNAARRKYEQDFGTDAKILAQIAGAASSADINALADKRRKLIGELSSYKPQGTTYETVTDDQLKVDLDERKAVFKAYYKAYDIGADVTFQQTAPVAQVVADTQVRVDLNKRAAMAMNDALTKALQLKVGIDNIEYEKAVDAREKAVQEFKELGGVAENANYKDLDDSQLQVSIAARKAIIAQAEAVYVNQRPMIDDIKKLNNSDAKMLIDKRQLLLQAIAARDLLKTNNDSPSKADTILNDMIKKNDDEYEATLKKISKYTGNPKTGDPPTNSPPLNDLLVELKNLQDARNILLAQGRVLLDSNDKNLDINGVRLEQAIGTLDDLSNQGIEQKLLSIEAVTKSSNMANTYAGKLDTLDANTASTGQLVFNIDLTDLVKAENNAIAYRQSLNQLKLDTEEVEADIKLDNSLDGQAKKDLEQRVTKLLSEIQDVILSLDGKDQDIKDGKANQANAQQTKNRIRQYVAEIDKQNLQSDTLQDKFNVAYETETKYAISMLQKHLDVELARVGALSGDDAQAAGDFTSKLNDLTNGKGDYQPGEEISITIQSLSNFDAPDNGQITGNTANSQRTTFTSVIRRGPSTYQLLQANEADAPFKSIDLGWEESDTVDSVFISSWARLVPNRDSAESKKRLESMGLDWLTETIYVDMLDRTRVFNYNGFLTEYIALLKNEQNKDFARRAEYTDNGNPIVCTIEIPGNTSLGGIFAVPVDLVSVGVAGEKPIEFLAAPSIKGLIPSIRKNLIEAENPGQKTRTFPSLGERRDINNILKTFFEVDGNGVRAYPKASTIDVTDDTQFGLAAWEKVLEDDAKKTVATREHLREGTEAKASYEGGYKERACADAAFNFIQTELIDLAKIKLRFHRIQPYQKMTQGASVKKGLPYLTVQCSGLNNYCVLIKDNRSLEFDFLDDKNKLYIFNVDGKSLRKHNDSVKIAVAAQATSVNSAPPQLLDTDDEDVSNFRFIPNI